jgi:hypothetical protein
MKSFHVAPQEFFSMREIGFRMEKSTKKAFEKHEENPYLI